MDVLKAELERQRAERTRRAGKTGAAPAAASSPSPAASSAVAAGPRSPPASAPHGVYVPRRVVLAQEAAARQRELDARRRAAAAASAAAAAGVSTRRASPSTPSAASPALLITKRPAARAPAQTSAGPRGQPPRGSSSSSSSSTGGDGDDSKAKRAKRAHRAGTTAAADPSPPTTATAPGSAITTPVVVADPPRDATAATGGAADVADTAAGRERAVVLPPPPPPLAPPPEADAEAEQEQLARLRARHDEIIRRLRAREQPIRLFGETDVERFQRLQRLEATEDASFGQRDEFRLAMAKAAKGLDLELLRGGPDAADAATGSAAGRAGGSGSASARSRYGAGAAAAAASSSSSSGGGGGDMLDGAGPALEKIDPSGIGIALYQSDPLRARLLIVVYLSQVLRQWDKHMQQRTDDVKRSVAGKHETVLQAQSSASLASLFKALRNDAIEPDVVARICEICDALQRREYLQANDAYLRLSIGNAPWPIGVTMVGIHERSAREKIFSSHVGHVLNDETQRRWIQALKRLMTFAQTRWPPDDPAKLMG